jgi:hypothetical protein
MVAKVPESAKRRRGARAFVQQVEHYMLKAEIERLTAELVATRQKLRAERYRTRRLVDIITKQSRLAEQARKPAPIPELGEFGEALAVLAAQQRFKSNGRTY